LEVCDTGEIKQTDQGKGATGDGVGERGGWRVKRSVGSGNVSRRGSPREMYPPVTVGGGSTYGVKKTLKKAVRTY